MGPTTKSQSKNSGKRIHRGDDNDDIYASTPISCLLRLLLTLALIFNWIVRTGGISTAFLPAKAATEDLFMFPPTEFCNPEDHIAWKLNKAIYGLRSSPKALQNHLAETLQQLSMQRLTGEPNLFKKATRNAFILVYGDDLLFLNWESQQLSTSSLQTSSDRCYCDQQVT